MDIGLMLRISVNLFGLMGANQFPFPLPAYLFGREKPSPLRERGGAGRLVGVAVLEVARRRKVVVDRGMG
jgi:hypothetical protein